jgi:hypothetical protein
MNALGSRAPGLHVDTTQAKKTLDYPWNLSGGPRRKAFMKVTFNSFEG